LPLGIVSIVLIAGCTQIQPTAKLSESILQPITLEWASFNSDNIPIDWTSVCNRCKTTGDYCDGNMAKIIVNVTDDKVNQFNCALYQNNELIKIGNEARIVPLHPFSNDLSYAFNLYFDRNVNLEFCCGITYDIENKRFDFCKTFEIQKKCD